MPNGCAEPDLIYLDRHLCLSMIKRGLTTTEIRDAYDQGMPYPAVDVTAGNASATRFVHLTSGKSVVINKATRSVIHVGRTGFQY